MIIPTVTKADLEHVVYNCSMTAHYTTIFQELMGVYEPDTPMDLGDMLRLFARKKFAHSIPGFRERARQDIRYSDYIIPLFYAAYICKGSKSSHVIKELLGMILKDSGHFFITPEDRRTMLSLLDEEFNYRKHYWGLTTLSSEEAYEVQDKYQRYLLIVIK